MFNHTCSINDDLIIDYTNNPMNNTDRSLDTSRNIVANNQNFRSPELYEELIIHLYFLIFIALPCCDLYLSYNKITCQNIVTPLNISLATWLQVYGYFLISLIFIVAVCCSICVQLENKKMNRLVKYLNIIYSIVSLPWLTFGFILYFKYLGPKNICGQSITTFIPIRLVIGMIMNLISIMIITYPNVLMY